MIFLLKLFVVVSAIIFLIASSFYILTKNIKSVDDWVVLLGCCSGIACGFLVLIEKD